MPAHLIGLTGVAEMLGVSRQRVHQLLQDEPLFPQPVLVLAAGSVWNRNAVEDWASAHPALVRGQLKKSAEARE
jgi:predicted DNA-binding transcriptional regulator AlpA